MTSLSDRLWAAAGRHWPWFGAATGGRPRIPIFAKVALGFLTVIAAMSLVFILVGVRFLGDLVVTEAQEKVRNDLNAAREIYDNRLDHVSVVVQLNADRPILRDALVSGDLSAAGYELIRVMLQQHLDVLTVTDASGKVLLRAGNLSHKGDDQSGDEFVSTVLQGGGPVAGTTIVPQADLLAESAPLAAQARKDLVDTPRARATGQAEQTSGMMLKAAAPIVGYNNKFLGVLYGGVLLDRDASIVDKIKQTVYEDVQYEGKDIGTATIFQDDVRIATNVRDTAGARAIGTRASEDVFDQVVGSGRPWIGRAFVVNNWYITAYEPIRDLAGRAVGMLYVGVLEDRYTDVRSQIALAFLAIMLLGTLGSMLLSFVIARRLTSGFYKLTAAAADVARGNLDVQVRITSNDEVQDLAEAFNTMAAALRKRDEMLREYAQKRIQQSERLALVGQLAAGVAHELNNPLQGIVAYSHLLLEDLPEDPSVRESADIIIKQADRCIDIVRGLSDFSRQNKPHKRPCDANVVLGDCVKLVCRQALFHNIEIVEQYDPHLPLAVIDPSQMQQVFMNMIINAAKAMVDGGRLTLATRPDVGGEFIEIEITDTGHGISQDNLERVFEPFFTTRHVGEGVGLGLAISYGIVKEHKGNILVESEVGKGTTFRVRLPIASEPEGTDNE